MRRGPSVGPKRCNTPSDSGPWRPMVGPREEQAWLQAELGDGRGFVGGQAGLAVRTPMSR